MQWMAGIDGLILEFSSSYVIRSDKSSMDIAAVCNREMPEIWAAFARLGHENQASHNMSPMLAACGKVQQCSESSLA